MLKKNLLNISPYKFTRGEKEYYFKKGIKELTNFHKKNCKEYKKILLTINTDNLKKKQLSDFTFLPTNIFKKFDLKSVPKNKVIKKLVSSGTSNNSPSKIYLDKNNASNQVRVLNIIMSTLVGKQRLPMLIIDQNPKLKNRSILNARSAAIFGFSIFGKDHTYLLNESGEIDYKLLNNFMKKYCKEKFLIFGFTSLIYKNLIKKLSKRLVNYDFKNGVLLHGGGWKKLEILNINNKFFKEKLFEKLGLINIYNYYGLVEQTGSIFIESKKCGYFHTSNFSDILIRDDNFQLVKNGSKGLIQLLSLLPTSYPGHNILTEDIGQIVGEDNCKCGLKGKYFMVHGRAKNTELRGCSDI